MTTRIKILIVIVVVAVSAALAVLIGLGFMNAGPLVGLLGVVVGALISEFSHYQSAREERRHQLRLAALDRRLQAHQEAFSHWRRIMKDIGDPVNIGQTVMDCQEWWDNNCLYLTAEARQAFSHAYMTAHTYDAIRRTQDTQLVQHETDVITRAGKIIVQGVELPTISEGEEKRIQPDAKGDA